MIDILIKSTYNENNILDTNNIIEESYFNSAMEFIKEVNNEYRDSSKKLYVNILESKGNVYSINESFGGFFRKVKEIIMKFINFIRKLFSRFIAYLHKLVGSDKYLIKHEKEFSSFTNEDSFNMDIFKYSFDPDIPVVENTVDDLFDKFTEEMNNKILYTTEPNNDIHQTSKLSMDNIKAFVADYNREIEDSIDSFRGIIIGQDGTNIDSSDFADELYRLYRSGDTTKYNEEIIPAYVMEALSFNKNYNKFIDGINKTKNDIEKEYTKVSKRFDNLIYTNDNGEFVFRNADNDYDTDRPYIGIKKTDNENEIALLNTISKNMAKVVQDVSNAHLLAFGAKLDAAKECCKQNKDILYKAYSKIIKNHKYSKEV